MLTNLEHQTNKTNWSKHSSIIELPVENNQSWQYPEQNYPVLANNQRQHLSTTEGFQNTLFVYQMAQVLITITQEISFFLSSRFYFTF